jgi:hypothetical protein
MIGSILVSILLGTIAFDPLDDPAALADYNAKRLEIADTADAHWKLGLWAEQKGLKGEATVEFLAVIRLDPGRDAAWKKLGYVKRNDRWVSTEQIAAEKAEAEAQRQADAKWLPIVKKARAMLGQKGRQAESEATLLAIKDPRAIPSIWKVFGQGTAEDQERAIDILGRIDDLAASKAIAGLAVFGKTDLVRRVAVETLTRRNPDDVLMLWIGLLDKPLKYEVKQVAGAGSAGYLMVEGEKFNVRRWYTPPSMSQTQAVFVNDLSARGHLALQFNSTPIETPPPGAKPVGYDSTMGSLWVYDYTWKPKAWVDKKVPDPSAKYQTFEKGQIEAKFDRDFEIDETAKMAAGAQAQLQADVNAIEAGNATVRELNARLSEALRRVSGKDFGDDKEAWLKWYIERRGYKYIPVEEREKKTVEVQVALPYVPSTGPPVIGEGGGAGGPSPKFCVIWDHEKGQRPVNHRCFAAGTLILTSDGLRPIETLRAGDFVLTSDGPNSPTHPHPIAEIHRSTSDRTLALTIDGETIVTTDGHPLWKVGQGWTPAVELRVGDRVASRNGSSSVEAIEARPSAEVWNLEVIEGATYQVGRQGLVAHDLGPIAEIR